MSGAEVGVDGILDCIHDIQVVPLLSSKLDVMAIYVKKPFDELDLGYLLLLSARELKLRSRIA